MSLHGQAEEQTRTKKDVQIARKKIETIYFGAEAIDASSQQEKPHRT